MNFITKVICRNCVKVYRNANTLVFHKFRSDMAGKRSHYGVQKQRIRNAGYEFIDRFGAPEFELVRPSHKQPRHAVMYDIPYFDVRHLPGYTQLIPYQSGDANIWDSDHVRMPFSPYNEQNSKNAWGKDSPVERWGIIKEALQSVENGQIKNIYQLTETILSYNPKHKTDWQFPALHALCDHLNEDENKLLFCSTLPAIANLALKLPELIKAPLPLLKRNWSASVSLTQEQISSLLANAFFCTFPWRNAQADRQSEYHNYPNINFWRLFNAQSDDNDVTEKLKCILNYFKRVCPNIVSPPPLGVVTISRRSVRDEKMPRWGHSHANVGDVLLHVDPELGIEHQDGIIQLDFANKYLGGGVLGRGSVQEEIRFAVCPELMVSMLFVEKMEPGEAVMILGAERYNNYVGYSRSFTWNGDHRDKTPYDSSARRRVAVLAIDAMPFKRSKDQYHKDNLDRELNKAWVGFSFFTNELQPGFNYPGVATGNWGCGAFGGSPQLKSLIQLMAAAEARRHMAYVTFGDWNFSSKLNEMYECLARHKVTVAQLYSYILDFGKQRDESDLYNYLFGMLGEQPPWFDNNGHRSRRSLDKKQRTIPDLMRKELRSPDLFSQDDDQSDNDSQKKPKKTEATTEYQNRQSSSKVTDSATEKALKHKLATAEQKITDSQHKTVTAAKNMTDLCKTANTETRSTAINKLSTNVNKLSTTKNKMADKHKMATTEKKTADSEHNTANAARNMTDSLYNIANTNTRSTTIGKLTTSVSKLSTTKSKMADKHKMATAENKMASQTSRLFDEMQRFDEDNGRLNLSISHTSETSRNKRGNVVLIESDASTDEDEKESKSQMKKKLCSKITDYFSRKPV